MSRAKETKLYRTFVKGLITEASYLTYPEDASFDELNTVLSRKGSRSRRFGINYTSSDIINDTTLYGNDYAQNEFVWKAVGNKSYRNILVRQFGSKLRFFDLSVDPTADGLIADSVDLSTHIRPGASATDLNTSFCMFASGRGYLFVVNSSIEPLVISYDPTTLLFTVQEISILTRDFEGLNDGLANDEEPATLSKEHHYNLQNQGWVTGSQSATVFSPVTLNGYTYDSGFSYINPFGYSTGTAYQASTSENPIFKFQAKLGRYPGNNKQWWVARAEADDTTTGVKAGDFLPETLNRLYSGNNRSPKGHYVLNAFRKDRSSVSGISGISIEDLNIRPGAVSFFAGRVWFAAEGTVYYSQILDGTTAIKAGLCYQEADPTAEDISDLIDSDGGVIPIPESDSIVRIIPFAEGMVVFATNGVWFISGGNSPFTATNIAVSKISPIGTNSPLSVVETDDIILWWSEIGIQALQQSSGQFGPIAGKFGNTNISEQTIQTFYNSIDAAVKPYVKACYDNKNNSIYWIYASEDVTKTFVYDSVIIFDLTLQAFYPWKFSSLANGPEVTGIYLDIGMLTQTTEENVLDGIETVVDSGITVTDGVFSTDIRPTNVTLITSIPSQGFVFSLVINTSYSDWQSFDNIGAAYPSYIYTGYELNEDAMRRKQIIYLVAHFKRTEDGEGGGLSSCEFRAAWDWSNNSNSNKWSAPVEAYRPRKRPSGTLADYVTGFDVVTSKNKVRGSGKSVQFRFGTSEIGKNFDILGWAVAFTGNTEP